MYVYGVSERVTGVQLGPLIANADRFASMPHWFTQTKKVVASEARATPTAAP